METVEQWMWIMGGVIIAGLIIVSGASLIGNYIRGTEISQAEDSFTFLTTTCDSVCAGGLHSQEIKSLMFPSITEEIYLKDSQTICLNLTGETPLCKEIEICSVSLDTINLKEDGSDLFFLIQKALGNKKASKIRFSISKEELTELRIGWDKEYAK